MRVCVTGATGFIGRALVPVLRRRGHDVAVWVRAEDRARSLLGADVEIVSDRSGPDTLERLVGRSDAVVNLAGEPILGRRWTAARREVLRASRVDLTARLARAMAASRSRPRVLVSGSAVGYYGDRRDERLTERSTPGGDFLADLCQAWESATRSAEEAGVRVALIRTGVVLGRDGGALAQMLPPFLLGAGGPIASGRQFMPWIHLHDLVEVIATALVDERYRGPINGVAQAVTNRDFARSLGRALGRPTFVPTPGLALRLVFGDAAAVLLGSQRAEPAALEALGYPFRWPALDGALADIIGGAAVSIVPSRRALAAPLGARTASAADESDAGARYLRERPPVYELRTTTILDVPLHEAFAFFARAENLGALTPPSMRFAIDGAVPTMGEGASIRYRLRVGGVPVRWATRIAAWRPGLGFVDLQERGPYRSWWHEHSFSADGDRTRMEDRVLYAPPFGVVGRIANRLFIAPALRRVFKYRGDVMRLRFGAAA